MKKEMETNGAATEETIAAAFTEDAAAENENAAEETALQTAEQIGDVCAEAAADYTRQIGNTVYHWAFGPMKIHSVELRAGRCPLVVCSISDEEGIRFPALQREHRMRCSGDGFVRFQVLMADFLLMNRPADVVKCDGYIRELAHRSYNS